MKLVMRTSFLLASAFLLASGTARAATIVEADVPFAFSVRGQLLPPGKYRVERSLDSSILMIEGEHGVHATVIAATTVASDDRRHVSLPPGRWLLGLGRRAMLGQPALAHAAVRSRVGHGRDREYAPDYECDHHGAEQNKDCHWITAGGGVAPIISRFQAPPCALMHSAPSIPLGSAKR